VDDSRSLFTDLKDSARGVKPSTYFMMRTLLHSRVDLDESVEESGEDEDMNVYLAHLLKSFDDPVYAESARSFLHAYDHEVLGRLARSTDARLKYKIYKTDTDFLLVSIGVFDNPNLALMNRLPAAATTRRAMEPTEDVVMGRGRTCYRFAYQYSQLVPRQQPMLTDVLEKLARGFDRYTRVLAHLRGEYFDVARELSRGEVYHLEQSVDSEERRRILQERQDAFLDAYADWKRAESEDHRLRLERAAQDLREIDPDFTFDPDEEPDEPEERERQAG
jgi:hypothetical protein